MVNDMNPEAHFEAARNRHYADYLAGIDQEEAHAALVESKIDAFHQHKGLWANGQYLTLLHARTDVMDHPEMIEMAERFDLTTDPAELEALGRAFAELDARLMAEAIRYIAEASIEYDAQINAEDACDDAA